MKVETHFLDLNKEKGKIFRVFEPKSFVLAIGEEIHEKNKKENKENENEKNTKKNMKRKEDEKERRRG